ncbi:signal peptide peptidase-domain-containing protein [Lipomyces tetrasporus]|uniref:Signal peptide peptidase-domain-containing protein n=1 Tax=Lipomyces tetrasporus TaxID=54092 RepID=A0AAD7QR62_9ASCO|nr:signal peptide peptidase-domain-containing protein [Lipomyces tetrasporus]KAJ8099780.1 signal peptide peptidase-domain-containing protein [Lipomyces tetrasporus]
MSKYLPLSIPTSSILEFLEQHHVDPVILTYSVLLVSAVVVIYCGSHATLHRPDTALPADPKDPIFDPADLSPPPSREKLMEEDAYLMPVIGGVMLVGIYFLIKKLSAKYIELFFNMYFAIFGVFAVAKTFGSALKVIAKRTGASLTRWRITVVENPPWDGLEEAKQMGNGEDKSIDSIDSVTATDATDEKSTEREDLMKQLVKKPTLRQMLTPSFILRQYQISSQLSKLPPVPEEVGKWYVSSADILGLPIGLAVVVGNWYTQNWLLGNILGTSFAFSSIQILTIDSFRTGYIMLSGLFIYDIFFVFGTDIMVTVATSLTVPIKLTAPRPATASSPRGSNAMLGLGDIIVPAIFLSLCLRFDLWNFHRKNPNLAYASARKFPKPFFNVAMLLYAAALVTTIVIMHAFKTAQPALLYLCPGIGGAVIATALLRNEWSILWCYKEETKEDKQERLKEEERKQNAEAANNKTDSSSEAKSSENQLVDGVGQS